MFLPFPHFHCIRTSLILPFSVPFERVIHYRHFLSLYCISQSYSPIYALFILTGAVMWSPLYLDHTVAPDYGRRLSIGQLWLSRISYFVCLPLCSFLFIRKYCLQSVITHSIVQWDSGSPLVWLTLRSFSHFHYNSEMFDAIRQLYRHTSIIDFAFLYFLLYRFQFPEMYDKRNYWHYYLRNNALDFMKKENRIKV